MGNIAVIDIGSNSIRMQVSEFLEKSYRIVDDYKELTRIGDDVFEKGYFSEKTIRNIIDVLKLMKRLLDNRKIEVLNIVATEPFREAKNSIDVVDLIKKECGFDVEIISGEQEAYLIYLAAAANFQMSHLKVLVVDIGGGSTEFSLVDKGELICAISTKLGCSRVTKRFIKHDPPLLDEIFQLKNYISRGLIKASIDNAVDFLDTYVDIVICTGGTMNNVADISYKENSKSDSIVKYVERKFLKKLTSDAEWKTVDERMKMNNLEPKRADIILPAMVLVDLLLEKTACSGFYSLRAGLRNGLTISVLNNLGIELPFQNEIKDVSYSRLIEIGNKFSFEEEHARHVTDLAKIIFESLKEPMKLNGIHWKLLEAAAILHDIGNYISYSSHHKHSYYLIKNSDIVGFNDNEIEMIANIARYHRRSLPKEGHEPYKNLSTIEKNTINKLSGILKVADGLDRSHKSLISDLKIEIRKQDIDIIPQSTKDLYLERKGFVYKKDLLEKTTGKKIHLL